MEDEVDEQLGNGEEGGGRREEGDLGHMEDELDEQLGNGVAWRRLAAQDDGPRHHGPWFAYQNHSPALPNHIRMYYSGPQPYL